MHIHTILRIRVGTYDRLKIKETEVSQYRNGVSVNIFGLWILNFEKARSIYRSGDITVFP